MPFHVLGFKCPNRECGGYNTRQIMHADANYTSLYQVSLPALPLPSRLFRLQRPFGWRMWHALLRVHGNTKDA